MTLVRLAAIPIGDYRSAILSADKKAKSEIRNMLRREANYHHRRLNNIVSGWKHKVKFRIGTRLRLNDDILGIEISTNNDIFRFLDEGTSRRTRRMNPTYIPKTEHQSFYQTGPGGYVVGVGNMPGIEARQWFDWIERDVERSMPDTVDEILQSFVQDANNW